jgi:hypothetical protein
MDANATLSYDAAVRALYQTPHDGFVAERKRLADELRAAGDRVAASKLAKLPRPTISSWVVNQLYWHARDQFDAMLAAAQRLREGDLTANAAHHEAIAKLRQRAGRILADASHTATEATLRRVTTNLAAIAAIGSFEPDPPGVLSADRDAPGFAGVGIVAPPSPPTTSGDSSSDARGAEDERNRREQHRLAEQRARLDAERERIAAALRTAKGELEAGVRRIDTAARELVDAEAAVTKLRAVVEGLEHKLAELRD